MTQEKGFRDRGKSFKKETTANGSLHGILVKLDRKWQEV